MTVHFNERCSCFLVEVSVLRSHGPWRTSQATSSSWTLYDRFVPPWSPAGPRGPPCPRTSTDERSGRASLTAPAYLLSMVPLILAIRALWRGDSSLLQDSGDETPGHTPQKLVLSSTLLFYRAVLHVFTFLYKAPGLPDLSRAAAPCTRAPRSILSNKTRLVTTPFLFPNFERPGCVPKSSDAAETVYPHWRPPCCLS